MRLALARRTGESDHRLPEAQTRIGRERQRHETGGTELLDGVPPDGRGVGRLTAFGPWTCNGSDVPLFVVEWRMVEGVLLGNKCSS